MIWFVLSIPVVVFVFASLIIIFEERYYAKHLDKPRPDVNIWP